MDGNPTEAFGLKLGDRIRLISMGPDPDPILPGSTGIVIGLCASMGLEQISVSWDSGRSLGLIPSQDSWEIIGESGK